LILPILEKGLYDSTIDHYCINPFSIKKTENDLKNLNIGNLIQNQKNLVNDPILVLHL